MHKMRLFHCVGFEFATRGSVDADFSLFNMQKFGVVRLVESFLPQLVLSESMICFNTFECDG